MTGFVFSKSLPVFLLLGKYGDWAKMVGRSKLGYRRPLEVGTVQSKDQSSRDSSGGNEVGRRR